MAKALALLALTLLLALVASASGHGLAIDVVAPTAHFRVKQLTNLAGEDERYRRYLYSPSDLAKATDPKLRGLAPQLKSKVNLYKGTYCTTLYSS